MTVTGIGRRIMHSETDVIIIGAGSAGLSAAKELARLGLRSTVIEASHRIGGRAYSEEIVPGVWFDLGCAWLTDGDANPFAEIANRLGIALGRATWDAYNNSDDHRFIRNGTRLTGEEHAACRRYYVDSYAAIAAAAGSEPEPSIGDVIDLESPCAPPFLESIATGWGVDVDGVSCADNTSSGGALGYPVPHGYGNLVAAWGADVEVTLNARAECIDWSGPGVAVETPKGTIRASLALVTVSTGMLASGELNFAPLLPDWKLEAILGLPMGTENKMGIAFYTDVFGADGRGHHTVWSDDAESAKVDVNGMGFNSVSVFTGGRHGIWLEKQGPQACHDFAVDRIAEIFGNDIRKHVIRSITTAWSTEPWTRGSWACALPGQAYQRDVLARSIDDRLFFAGEATSVGKQGTCDGAYRTGIRAAQEIAAHLKGAS
ncbi:MAG: NAD(P)/FAD-dependent oxidoreductase [Alphaproteobacteria bacterium]|nr:NAD(P)/FAD-dependent oxidoreductase [Alphaproteobacteria bacterium]